MARQSEALKSLRESVRYALTEHGDFDLDSGDLHPIKTKGPNIVLGLYKRDENGNPTDELLATYTVTVTEEVHHATTGN